jgi:hypothetical protein
MFGSKPNGRRFEPCTYLVSGIAQWQSSRPGPGGYRFEPVIRTIEVRWQWARYSSRWNNTREPFRLQQLMEDFKKHREDIEELGYTVIENVFSGSEIGHLAGLVGKADPAQETFRKTADLFAIRQFLKQVPDAVPIIFNKRFTHLIHAIFGQGYFAVKAIYFDKPGASNWFVSYHQDLTISVKQRFAVPGFGPWTVKQQQFAVQPPVGLLEKNFTIRIHLDHTDAANGALRVIPRSHRKGIYRPDTIDWAQEREDTCIVPEGGIMVMRPLLLHASSRSAGESSRRVIHIEFSDQELPTPLQWAELLRWTPVSC